MGAANKIFNGSRLRFRPVTVGDAAYIQELRTRHGEHLSASAPSVAAQQAWIERYLTRAEQGQEYYFVIERLDDYAPCGVVRLYEIVDDHFTWGSWILDANKPAKAALDSALLIYEIAFETLGCDYSVFDVRANNQRTLAFHRRFGAVETGSDAENIYFRIDAKDHSARSVRLTEQIWALDAQSLGPDTQPKSGRRRGSILARHYQDEPTEFWPRLAFHYKRKTRQLVDRDILRQQENSIRREYQILCRPKKALRQKNNKLRALNPLFLNRSRRSLFSVSRSATQIFPMVTYQAIAKTFHVLAPSVSFQVVPPHCPGALVRPETGEMPAITARIFQHADAFSCASALVSTGQIAVPEFYINHQTATIDDGELLVFSLNNRGIVKRHSVSQSYESGIMLFGSGASNWYHWLIETLPAAYLSQNLPDNYDDYPLVIPGAIAKSPTFRQSLELFRGSRRVITLGKGMHRFTNLIQIDAPVREPMNMRKGFWPTAKDYAFNGQVLRDYRAQILRRLQIDIPMHQDKIFLARGNDRRSYNQEALLEIAVRHGFRAVFPENLSFREQVMLYVGASHIIGPSGAAFANTLFCQPKTRLLSWLIPQYSGFCSYANIAELTGSDLRYLFATPDKLINSTSDGFGASYHINIAEFQTALAAIEQPDY